MIIILNILIVPHNSPTTEANANNHKESTYVYLMQKQTMPNFDVGTFTMTWNCLANTIVTCAQTIRAMSTHVDYYCLSRMRLGYCHGVPPHGPMV